MLKQHHLRRLEGLFTNPDKEWPVIDREYLDSVVTLCKKYFIPLLIILPFIFLLAQIPEYRSLKSFIIKGGIAPLMFVLVYLAALFIVGIAVEEVALALGGDAREMSGPKLVYFSALPFLYSLVFFPIPYLGKIVVIITFFYQFFLLIKGGKILYEFSDRHLTLWVITILATFMILAGILLGAGFVLNFAIRAVT